MTVADAVGEGHHRDLPGQGVGFGRSMVVENRRGDRCGEAPRLAEDGACLLVGDLELGLLRLPERAQPPFADADDRRVALGELREQDDPTQIVKETAQVDAVAIDFGEAVGERSSLSVAVVTLVMPSTLRLDWQELEPSAGGWVAPLTAGGGLCLCRPPAMAAAER